MSEKRIDITGGIPSEIYVAIGRDRYEDEYDVARATAEAVREEMAATLTARESELAEAQRRAAELEEALNSLYAQAMHRDYHSGTPTETVWFEWALDISKALLLADRITHIPGKEGDDGEMH